MCLAHGLHGTGGALGLGLFDDIEVADELVRGHTKVRQTRCRQTNADHLHISHHAGSTRQDGGYAIGYGLGVKVGQSVEIKIGVGVDHAAHDRPLFGRVGVGANFAVDHGKRVVLDGPPSGGQLLGDNIGGRKGHDGTPMWGWSCGTAS
ncbi:hypothetical protein GALL_518230 [mine drainage metagenome]|uniref:Uncharacterized protein n=1 Tax=mine drainage metagenome TaxID=410659 RepID=A0A1J5P5X7_9ZZZZ